MGVEFGERPLSDFLIGAFSGHDDGGHQRDALTAVGFHDVREDLLPCLFAHERAALRAILCPEFDIEQTKEMLDFRDRRNCRLAAAAACTLLDCHRRCNARDAFDVGLRRRLCDGTCVGVETFQITSLSFGKNDAEGKRRFP